VTGNTSFFNAGDMVSVSGAGGADLPAFTMQTVIAPSGITVTSPVCASGACADVDRAADAMVTWTGGGAGRVSVAYLTTTDDGTKAVTCNFDASAGSGTVPVAALMTLDQASAPGFFGLESITPIDSKTIMVGTLPVLFGVQQTSYQGTFTTTD